MTIVRSPADRRGVLVYLALAFGLSWAPFLAVPFGADPAGLLFLMPVAPAIAAVVVRRWVTREGFGDAGLRPTTHGRWYLLAVTWPLASAVLAVSLALVLGVGPDSLDLPWGLVSPRPWQLLGWMAVSVLVAPIILGEELGWRGYLQLRLFPERPRVAAVVVGVVWGVWHYPMILAGGQPIENRGVTLLLFPVATTALSLLLGWLRVRTASIWPGTLAHAANNVTGSNLTALAFTGSVSGELGTSASVVIVLAEAILLTAVSAFGWRRASPTRLPAVRPAPPSADVHASG